MPITAQQVESVLAGFAAICILCMAFYAITTCLGALIWSLIKRYAGKDEDE